MRRGRTRACVALVLVPLGALVALVGMGCSGDDDADSDAAATPTTIATGGIEIEAPDGWLEIPLPALGFGVAVPDGWEATRLDEQGLSSVGQAAPVVPGFADAAHNAAQTGAVLYAAGVEADGQITDLKVRAVLETGVSDVAGLEAYARQLAADAALQAPELGVVADASRPTVQVRFSAAGVEGTERLVLSPRGVVYSLIVTSEAASGHDELAEQIFTTFALSESA